MGRYAQIIFLFALFLTSTAALAQNGKKPKANSIQAYPVYHLQGLDFEQDSSVIGLYGWIKTEDRKAVFQFDTNMVALVMDTLVSLPQLDLIPIDAVDTVLIETSNLASDSALIYQAMALDGIYYWDEGSFNGPEMDYVDSLQVENNILEQDIFVHDPDTLRTEAVLTDSLMVPEIEMLPELTDSLAQELTLVQQDSTLVLPVMQDSLRMASDIEDPLIFPIESEESILIEDPTDETNKIDANQGNEIPQETTIQEAEVKSTSENKPVDGIEKSTTESQEEIPSTIIEEDRPKLNTEKSRRTIGENSLDEGVISVRTENRSARDTLIIVERVVETAPTYTGEYAGLSEAEREKQLILDAESRRDIESKKLELEKIRLETQLSTERGQTKSEEETQELPRDTLLHLEDSLIALNDTLLQDSLNISVQDSLQGLIAIQQMHSKQIPEEPVLVIQRDTLSEKAMADLAKRLDEEAVKDSLYRQEERARIDNRFDRLESKMDTLLNALGKPVVLDKSVYSVPSKELNIFFAVNSHTISGQQLRDLQSYLAQLSNFNDYRVVLSGYADNSGHVEYNKMLVEKRINAVKDAILNTGVAPAELLVNNYGKQESGTRKAYNQNDRKVTIQIYTGGQAK